jgi:hypothetical protein
VTEEHSDVSDNLDDGMIGQPPVKQKGRTVLEKGFQ